MSDVSNFTVSNNFLNYYSFVAKLTRRDVSFLLLFNDSSLRTQSDFRLLFHAAEKYIFLWHKTNAGNLCVHRLQWFKRNAKKKIGVTMVWFLLAIITITYFASSLNKLNVLCLPLCSLVVSFLLQVLKSEKGRLQSRVFELEEKLLRYFWDFKAFKLAIIACMLLPYMKTYFCVIISGLSSFSWYAKKKSLQAMKLKFVY